LALVGVCGCIVAKFFDYGFTGAMSVIVPKIVFRKKIVFLVRVNSTESSVDVQSCMIEQRKKFNV
jgi:hypothetical protein